MCTHRKLKKVGRIINMTSEPVHVYDNATGAIVVFYPSPRRFPWLERLGPLPSDACYVFTPEMVDEMQCFEDCGYDVAIVASKGIGRSGIEVTTLMTRDHRDVVVFQERSGFTSVVVQESGCARLCHG